MVGDEDVEKVVKKEKEAANDGKKQTTTARVIPTTTTATATSSPLSPQHDAELNATKCKTKESNDDVLKETTSSTSFSSTTATAVSSPPPLHRQADTCCVCLEDLHVDIRTFARMTCCGKATHNYCRDNVFGSSMSREQKDKCPQCQVKLPKSHEEQVERVRGWADKGKAWAQAHLGNNYYRGDGVEQSYEKAVEYYTLAVQNGDPNAMFGLANI